MDLEYDERGYRIHRNSDEPDDTLYRLANDFSYVQHRVSGIHEKLGEMDKRIQDIQKALATRPHGGVQAGQGDLIHITVSRLQPVWAPYVTIVAAVAVFAYIIRAF